MPVVTPLAVTPLDSYSECTVTDSSHNTFFCGEFLTSVIDRPQTRLYSKLHTRSSVSIRYELPI